MIYRLLRAYISFCGGCDTQNNILTKFCRRFFHMGLLFFLFCYNFLQRVCVVKHVSEVQRKASDKSHGGACLREMGRKQVYMSF